METSETRPPDTDELEEPVEVDEEPAEEETGTSGPEPAEPVRVPPEETDEPTPSDPA